MKNQTSSNPLMIAASIILGLAGIALALLAMFGPNEAPWMLPGALICTAVGGVINIMMYAKIKGCFTAIDGGTQPGPTGPFFGENCPPDSFPGPQNPPIGTPPHVAAAEKGRGAPIPPRVCRNN